jgi:hypothetical protein
MSTNAIQEFLKSRAVPVELKKGTVSLWASPKVKERYLAADAQRWSLFKALAITLVGAFEQSNQSLGAISQLQRIVNRELPELAFWHCRPEPDGPSFLLAVLRKDETSAWGAELGRIFDNQ